MGLGALVLVLTTAPLPAYAEPEANQLTDLSLEELMNVEVTLVSRTPERRAGAAAALTVITNEDIERSGATTLPDALRMAPGVHVARIDSNKWAVSVRGFSDRFTNKLLVLMDGRSLYTPLFGGVFWDVQDTLLEDVDRIEVIRGPGGALWGANAVNGVINIVTKSARETHGALVSGGAGTEEEGAAAFRYGGKIGDNFHYRVYGKWFERDGGFNPSGPAFDGWHMMRTGFRTDWDVRAESALTVQGDLYDGKAGQRAPIVGVDPESVGSVNDDLGGGNILTRWHEILGESSDATLQAYYDRTARTENNFGEDRNTFDVDFQHRFPFFQGQEVLWGLGYRLTSDDFRGGSAVRLTPTRRSDQLVSGFIQDQIDVLETVRLTIGTKLEHNAYTGFEVQPSGRLAWQPTDAHTLWGAISRAVRTPTRAERNLTVDLPPGFVGNLPVATRLFGNHDVKAEELLAFEAGYRMRVTPDLFFDLAAFYNRYDNLASVEPGMPIFEDTPGGPMPIVPLVLANGLDGEVHGAEIAVDWMPIRRWRVSASYAYLDIDRHRDPGSTDMTSVASEHSSPQNQVAARSFLDLPANLKFDVSLRYVDNLPSEHTGSYVTFDARFAWRAPFGLELAVVGQNLAQSHHKEFAGGTEVQRGVFGKGTWRF